MKSLPPNSPAFSNLHIGTAGWTLPKQHAHLFPAEGSHLERHASMLNCVEINSSFHRPHMLKTWQRWAASTPAKFRFSVKLPKAITHTAKLRNSGALLQTFFDQVHGLGEKLGPLLVQLPPSLVFDESTAREFFTTLRELHPTSDNTPHQNHIALEPRHATWFTPAAGRLLRSFAIARVAADPPKGSPAAANPGGSHHLHYYRLHGAPRTYSSDYTEANLTALAQTLRATPPTTTIWVIFDNTALGHATANALQLINLLSA
ncbi:MAG: DUF72 domain-containing protein [Acidobacteriaceae bacterium]